MFARFRLRSLIAPALLLAAVAMALQGCEDNTTPTITKLTATPQCDVMKLVTKVNIDENDSSIVSIDTLGTWMEVQFFGRATSGNGLDNPTGANSPLEWEWRFDDGGSAKDQVNPTHKYTTPGEYSVQLTVRDKDGDADTATIPVLVGEAYSDLDILTISVEAEPEFTFSVAPGSVSVDLTQTWGDQFSLDKMNMVFNGTLESDCVVSGLFQQYLWTWDLSNTGGSPLARFENVDPAVLELNARRIDITANLSVTEAVTGIERQASTKIQNPVGLQISRTAARSTVPNTQDTLELTGYMLLDVTSLDVEIEYDGTALRLDDVAFDSAITDELTADWTAIDANRARITLTGTAGFSLANAEIKIADLVFTTLDAAPNLYPVFLRNPVVLRDLDTEPDGARVTTRDGAVVLDADCDADGQPDSFQLEYFADVYDTDGDGVIDSCQ